MLLTVTPPNLLSAFKNMEVLDVNLEEQMVTVNVLVISRCQNNSNHIPSIDLGDSPFVFSGLHNILNVEGCGYAAVLNDGEVITGCSTTCTNDTANVSDYFFGLGCCQTTIPQNLKSYSMDLTGLKKPEEDGACVSAFLGDERAFPINMTNRYHLKARNASFFPISLAWFLIDNDFHEIPYCYEGKGRAPLLNLCNGSYIFHRKCYCDIGRVGNPYLHHQCQESEDCRTCRDFGGTCKYEKEYADDFDGRGWFTITFNCEHTVYYTRIFRSSKSPLGVILGVNCIGLLFFGKFICGLHKLIKKAIAKRQKEKYFKRNGGLLLKQQEATKDGLVNKTILLTSKELETAPDHNPWQWRSRYGV